mmetsp:Transcript_28508/g.31999  ORF Transcript_28508/g.31999 Transcript_28508/m.31999 type:complete len:779 (-) Transcript_28508:97-2433(-)
MTRRYNQPSTPCTVNEDDDVDIFDGIFDNIDGDYEKDEIEIPPPPPPSSTRSTRTTGIDVENPLLLLKSSLADSNNIVSCNDNLATDNTATNEEIELERDSSLFCGAAVDSTKNWWNRLGSMMKVKQYEVMHDDKVSSTPNIKNMVNNIYDNGNRKTDNAEDNMTNDWTSTCARSRSRDTVLHHSMHDGSNDDDNDNNLKKRKEKDEIPSSLWETMSGKKVFGISYRLVFLVLLTLIAFIIFICLVAQFNSGSDRINVESSSNLVNTNGTSVSIPDNGTGSNGVNNDTVIDNVTATFIIDDDVSIGSNSTENGDEVSNNNIDGSSDGDDDDNDNDNELSFFCDEDGVTVEENGIILMVNQVIASGEYFCSPSKMYMIGMLDDLTLTNIDINEIVWSAGVTGGVRAILRADGSLVIENNDGQVIWGTAPIPTDFNNFDNRPGGNSPFFNFNRQLVFRNNDEGVIAIQQVPTMSDREEDSIPATYWMDGSPNVLTDDKKYIQNLEFPVRGTFYFPTFDSVAESWKTGDGYLPVHEPTLGWYSSSDSNVAKAHVEAMEYGKINLGIASWEGSDTNFDRSRITMLLDETIEQDTEYLKWTVYHESDRLGQLDEDDIQEDLEYLQKWFAWKESWAHIDGKPVIFVNNNDGCDAAERWNVASNYWYVVLRVFDGYKDCEYQPDSWHEQRVNDNNDGIDIEEGLYHNLAPGEWRSGRRTRPDMKRLSPGKWCRNVQDMIGSDEQWQLIVSFNEAAQGTSIEPSYDWRSGSGYGYYLDCLNYEGMY